MPRGRKKRWKPRGPRNWFDRNVKYLFLGLAAVAAVSLVTVALNSSRTDSSSAYSRPAETPDNSPDSSEPSGPVAAFIGDSYVHGTGASNLRASRWTTLVSGELGWQEKNLGRGGTGYLQTSDVNGCGLSFCPNYEEMVEQAAATSPAIVVVAGGQNDFAGWATDSAAITVAINATYTSIRTQLPDAQIVAVGPSTTASASQSVIGLDAAVQAAASSVGAQYVSLLQPSPIAPEMVLPGAHVNDAGHRAIADIVLTALQ